MTTTAARCRPCRGTGMRTGGQICPDCQGTGRPALNRRSVADGRDALIASLREGLKEAVKRADDGAAAAAIVAKLMEMVPLKDTIAALATGQSLFEYIRAKLSRLEEAERIIIPFAKYAVTLDECYPTRHGGEFEITPRISSPYATNDPVVITLADARLAADLLTTPKEKSK